MDNKKMNEIVVEISNNKVAESINFLVAQVYEMIDAKIIDNNFATIYTITCKSLLEIIRPELKFEIKILKMLLKVLDSYLDTPPIHFNICQN